MLFIVFYQSFLDNIIHVRQYCLKPYIIDYVRYGYTYVKLTVAQY